MAFEHRPVMSREVVELLVPVPPGWVIDATVGGGGHSRQILEAHPGARILGIDRDQVAVGAARQELAEFGERVRVVHGGFEHLTEIVRASGLSEGEIVGMLFDLGVSSPQLDVTERGFSYWSEAPLDMRMDNSQELTAETVVNTYGEDDLGDLIVASGEWRWGRRIAKAIVAARPLRTTGDLVDAIKTAIPAPARRKGGHPARRTFQAIRLEVNRELEHLEAGPRRIGPPARTGGPRAGARVPLGRGPHRQATLRGVVGIGCGGAVRPFPPAAAGGGRTRRATPHPQTAATE